MPKIDRELYVGIDPGSSGGLAAYNKVSRSFETLFSFKDENERDIWTIFETIAPSVNFALIESVHAMPKQGVSSMFSFGKNYGGLRMALIGNRIPFLEISPQSWQKFVGHTSIKDEPKDKKKKRILALAQQYFPNVELWKMPKSQGKMLTVCDAMLIAVYASNYESLEK